MSNPSQFVLRWEIPDVASTLANGHATSGKWKEKGFKWSAAITKNLYTADFTLTCKAPPNGPWKCEAVVEVSVLRTDQVLVLGGKTTAQFDEKNGRVLLERCHNWRNLMEPSMYNIGGTVSVQFKITILSAQGDFSDVDLTKFMSPIETSNVTLLIEDKKLVVSKEYLSMHSPVFNTTFFGKFIENGKEEVEIKDVDYEEFISLLLIIFPGKIRVYDATVEPILKLADRFQIERALDLAEQHLVTTSTISAIEKMRMADDYRLEILRGHILRSYKSVNDLKDFKDTTQFANFSDKTKAAICERIMELF